MASNISKAPMFRSISVRGFAKRPEGVPVGGLVDYKISSTTLPNNLIVASANNGALISRASIAFRAGSRYETRDNLGSTHVIRICAGLSTQNATQFAIARNIQQVGCSLTCTADREVIAYTLEGTAASVEKALPFLKEVATQPCFKPWEVSDNVPRLLYELASRSKQLRAIDLLHKAAYRGTGLGNSLFISKHSISSISSETLLYYFCKHFTSDRAAVIGLGIDHQYLVDFAGTLKLAPSKSKAEEPCDYKGGEIRSDKDGKLAHIAIAGQGAALTDAKEALSFAILQRCFGVGSSIKYGNESKGMFAKNECSGGVPTSIRALNISYANCGLFGAIISTPGNDAGTVVKSVYKALQTAKVSEDDFKRGKRQLKTAIGLALENGFTAVEDMGIQAVLTGSVANSEEILCAIDSINITDINDAAKSLASSKFSIASIGNLRTVPFLDELK